ncbi:MAG: GGDEF domain-containing protein [Candidatus Omnitrophica bacterium]|nr:GGDEF domain-containing protein [Candidatus Omnitrophota bacterium]
MRGLSTRATRLTVVKWLTVTVGLGALGRIVAALLVPAAVDPFLLHGWLLLVIALTVSNWFLFPLSFSATMSAVAMMTTLWVLTASHGLPLIWMDSLALMTLNGMAGMRQHKFRRRWHRLKQQVGDVDEGVTVKTQEVHMSQQSHQALQRKLAKYQHLHTLAEQLVRLVDVDAVARLAVEQAFALIGKSDVCLLFLVDATRQTLALHASQRAEGVAVIRTKLGDQFDHHVLRSQRPLLVNDIRRDFRFTASASSERPISSVIACPIVIGETVEGVLRLDSAQPKAYTQDDLRFLDIFLDLVNTALANARLFAQTQQLAITDGLTELYRRQPFLEQLGREVARATRSREPLAVVLLDIDHFKRYNDTYGHSAGDLILKHVASVVRKTVPPDGLCARYGGEEFAILLPKASRTQGMEVADRIRQSVEAHVRPIGNGSHESVTVSLGVAAFPDDATSDLELIRRSDQRLYQAKHAGRNQVCAA